MDRNQPSGTYSRTSRIRAAEKAAKAFTLRGPGHRAHHPNPSPAGVRGRAGGVIAVGEVEGGGP